MNMDDSSDKTAETLDEVPVEQTSPIQPSEDLPQNTSGREDTGETLQLQDKADASVDETPKESPGDPVPIPNSEPIHAAPPEILPDWLVQLSRYHNDSNGLLAAKENLKLVAVNEQASPAFYRKWSLEANQIMRLTSNLRRRMDSGKKLLWLTAPKY